MPLTAPRADAVGMRNEEHDRTAGGTDLLTGFGDHDKLFSDLAGALDPGASACVLAVIDLSGSAEHRHDFGSRANDELVARIARRLTRVLASVATFYRPRQDEFCVLIPGDLTNALDRLAGIENELNAENRSAVSAQIGIACLPGDAADAHELLIVADGDLRSRFVNRALRERRRRTPAL
jgi:predicted signal transduction protein with EAL and GGDEF domain